MRSKAKRECKTCKIVYEGINENFGSTNMLDCKSCVALMPINDRNNKLCDICKVSRYGVSKNLNDINKSICNGCLKKGENQTLTKEETEKLINKCISEYFEKHNIESKKETTEEVRKYIYNILFT